MPDLDLHRARIAVVNRVSLLAGRSWSPAGPGPVFVVGTGRCGSTLLVEILGSHVDLVAFPDEANDQWHPRLYPYERARLPDHPPIEADVAAFTSASLASWPRDHDRHIQRVFAGYSRLARGRRVCTKSAMVSFMLPTIGSLFPDARFVHIHRAGPPTVASYVRKNHGTYRRHRYDQSHYRRLCETYWNDCIVEIDRRRSEMIDPERSLVEVAYEDLCTDPGRVLGRLARFLEVTADGFRYDLGRIQPRDPTRRVWTADEAGPLMLEGMRLKGYVS